MTSKTERISHLNSHSELVIAVLQKILHWRDSEGCDGSEGLQQVAEDVEHRDPDDGPRSCV